MRPQNPLKERYGANRRKVLKSLGTAGTALTLGAGAVGTASAAPCELPSDRDYESQESNEWKDEDSDYHVHDHGDTYDRLTEIQSGLVYQSSTYVEEAGRWYHFFRSAGAVYTMRKRTWESSSDYSPIGMTNYQRLEITNDDTNAAALYTTDNPKDVGAAPSPSSGDDLNWGPAAWTVALAALSTNTYAAAAITAAQFLGALLDNSESASGDTVTYTWDYDWNDGPCESIHYGRYEFQSFDGYSHANFHVRNVGTYDGAGGVETRYDVYVDPVPDGLSTSADTADEPPAPGTAEYTGFLERSPAATKVPFERIEDRRIRELADGSPVYRAAQPYSEVTVNSRSLQPDET